VPFEEGLASTVEWYRSHADWWKAIKSGSGEYRRFYEKHYGKESVERK
jgi:dTDP-glucose 4,6-dehydratase